MNISGSIENYFLILKINIESAGRFLMERINF